MIFRSLLFAVALCGGLVRPAFADDLLLRIDCVGSDSLPTAEKDATQPCNFEDRSHPERTFYSVELLVRPGLRFHTSTTTGDRTLTCSGKLVVGDDGTFSVDASLEDNLDSDQTVVIAGGVSVSALRHTTRVNSSANVELDKPITFGPELMSRSDDRVSKRRFVVTLKKCDPKK